MKTYLLLFALFIFMSCEKDETPLTSNGRLGAREDARKHYDEQVCIVDHQSGILCFESVGNTCKKLKPCTAVASIGADTFFTASELSDWMNVELDSNTAFKYYMWQIDWFNDPSEW
jgi:hypothetical protein